MRKTFHKNILLFLASQTISLFGSQLVQYAVTWYITLKTQSGLMVTLSIIFGFVPTFFLSPFAGVWADRYNKKLLIALADSVIAVSTLILAVLFLLGYEEIWLLFVVSSVRALGAGIQTPAVGSLLPQLVHDESELTRVNAVNSSIQSLTAVACPMLSGLLLTVSDIESVFMIDVVTAVIGVLTLLLFVKTPAAEAPPDERPNYFSEMKSGFLYIKNHPFVKQLFIFMGIFLFFSAPPAFLVPLQVARSFGDDFWRLTAVEICFAVGMLIGGVVIAARGAIKNKVLTMAMACLALGLCTIALGLLRSFSAYLLVSALTGVAIPAYNTPSTVLLQEKVEPEYLGRVFGALTMIVTSMMPFGMLIFGPLADMTAIEWILIGSGLFVCLMSVFMRKNKALQSAEG